MMEATILLSALPPLRDEKRYDARYRSIEKSVIIRDIISMMVMCNVISISISTTITITITLGCR